MMCQPLHIVLLSLAYAQNNNDNYSMSTYYWRNTTVYWLRLLEMVIVAAYVGTIFVRMSTTTGNIGKIVGASFFNTWSVLI
jgi:hypothetical protein